MLFVLVGFLGAVIKILPEYERGVLLTLGKLAGCRGPGLTIVIPFVQQMMRVDLRTVTLEVPAQEIITKDNVPVKVNAVIYYRVVNPEAAMIQVRNFHLATSNIAQTTLRSTLGQHMLDELLSERDKINKSLQQMIDEHTAPWGIKVGLVEIKDVEMPQSMQRAMAKQAEAERERRAKIIAAEGEFQASENLARAAEVLARSPAAITLRYLQTLIEIATENNSTTLFPVPIDIFQGLGASRPPSPSA
ncbi:MAG: slipin family protein [Candidatus Riflebacteria bacterium]|nr:slipin family protein [Candidatus Riflebacteria bacterium]